MITYIYYLSIINHLIFTFHALIINHALITSNYLTENYVYRYMFLKIIIFNLQHLYLQFEEEKKRKRYW